MKTSFHPGIAARALLMALAMASCRRPPPSRAGVAITFDDHSIEEWHRALDLFRRYDAHATFFVDQFHLLTKEQLRLLEDIRRDGHEIGVHSVDHVNAHVYLAEQPGRTMEDYAREQVLPAVEAMRRRGFAPVSFSYPGGHGPPEGDAVLLRHFRMLRTNNHYAPFHAFDGARVAGARASTTSSPRTGKKSSPGWRKRGGTTRHSCCLVTASAWNAACITPPWMIWKSC